VSAEVGNEVISNVADDAAECGPVPGCVDPAGDCVSRRWGQRAAKDDVVRDLAELRAHADGLVGVVEHPLQDTVQGQDWDFTGGDGTLGLVNEGLDVVLERGSGGLREAGERARKPRTAKQRWCGHDKVGAGTSERIARRAWPRLWARVLSEHSDRQASRPPEDY
jgi:hypothetical protein